MSDLDFTFEQSPWEMEIEKLQPGERLSAARFLTVMEEETEADVEDAFAALEEKGIALDITSLPVIAASGDLAVRLRQEHQLVSQGKLRWGLEENDPLRLYLEEVARTPAAGDAALLAQEYAAGKEAVSDRLVALRLSRVIELAMEYTGKGVLLLDLIQEASLGLWQGILHYTGGDFEVYSDWWIRQYLARAVVLQARSAGLGQKLRQGMEDYRDVDQRLLGELGRNPTLEEIAEAMHTTSEDAAVFAGMLSMARSRQQIEAARQVKEPAPEDDQAVEDTAYFQSRQRILELLSTLTEQEAKLLSLRFGLEGGLPLSAQEVGQKMNMTAEEVLAMEQAALTQIRKKV